MIETFKGISKANWIAGYIFFCVVLSWVIYQQWFNNDNDTPEQIRVAFDPQCDLRAGPCETILVDGSKISFAIEPRSIPISEKLKLEVTVSGLDVDKVSVEINGVDMKMPPNVVSLEQTGKGHYSGKGALTFCTRSIMEWESVIQLDSGNKQINVPFRFITSK